MGFCLKGVYSSNFEQIQFAGMLKKGGGKQPEKKRGKSFLRFV